MNEQPYNMPGEKLEQTRAAKFWGIPTVRRERSVGRGGSLLSRWPLPARWRMSALNANWVVEHPHGAFRFYDSISWIRVGVFPQLNSPGSIPPLLPGLWICIDFQWFCRNHSDTFWIQTSRSVEFNSGILQVELIWFTGSRSSESISTVLWTQPGIQTLNVALPTFQHCRFGSQTSHGLFFLTTLTVLPQPFVLPRILKVSNLP